VAVQDCGWRKAVWSGDPCGLARGARIRLSASGIIKTSSALEHKIVVFAEDELNYRTHAIIQLPELC
jgi:hypothetical protein